MEAALRILMTADTVGGVWSYATELCRALSRYEVQVALATMGAPLSPDQRWEAAAVDGLEIHESTFKLEWMEDCWSDVREAGEWLLGLEAELRPDVVHLNGYAHGALPWRAPALIAGHSCVLSWWRAVKGEDAPAEWSTYRREVKLGLRGASHVVAPTAAMLSALEEHYGPFESAAVIPNGRSPARFPPGMKEPFIFSAGRLWDEAKNLKALEEAAEDLAWPVYVAGQPRHPEGGKVEFTAVRRLGPLSQPAMADRLSRAGIYALPARYEPFGLSILEAGLAGCALVLGDIPSLREVWDDAAVYVPPDDPKTLRSVLNDLADDAAARVGLAGRSRRRALEFTDQRMAQLYLATYLYLTGSGPRTARLHAADAAAAPAPQSLIDF